MSDTKRLIEMHDLAASYYRAIEKGKPFVVQCQDANDKWFDLRQDPEWNHEHEYRRKQEPKVMFVNFYTSGSWASFLSKEDARGCRSDSNCTTGRFVEDVDWDGDK